MKRNFSWSNFGVDFLKHIICHPNTPASKRPRVDMHDIDALSAKVGSLYDYPNDRFVKKYKDVIIDDFLANSVYLVSLFKRLEKRKYSDISVGTEEEMLERLHGMKMTSTVISFILDEMFRHGKYVPEDYESSVFTVPKTIDLKSAAAKEIPLRNYQQDARNALKNHFIKNDKDSGILVMPTGSGKTRVAAAFLLEDMIPEGRQIIWLTHRAMLIEQTADTIYTLSPSIKTKAPEKESFKMVCVSGSHSTIMRTEKCDDVIIFSVQTLVRNLPFLKGCLKEDVLIVVDEMHHAYAPSYRTVIKEIRGICKSAKLLGLTATPVRANDHDTVGLMKLFDNNIVYSISLNDLIVSGVLSKPEYIPVNTSVDFSSVITVDEKKYIEKWGELPAEFLDKMAQIAERNKLIIDTYLNGRSKYGKTIVFALNAAHCISLCEDFKAAGINCDYIYCSHPGNEEKIKKFKDGETDVLININMLTEGSDIPDIQTVFLTRPTGSDVLLMQMIGRGMRGVDCGGTETVNIVSFNDIWGRFNYWLDPKFLIDSELNEENDVSGCDESLDVADDKIIESKKIPWEALRYLLDNIHVSYAGEINGELALPSGWMDVVDADGADRRILVFESQTSGYLELRKRKELLNEDSGYSAQKIITGCFPDFGLTPSEDTIDIIASHYKLTGEFPHIYPFTGRKKIDAGIVAADLKARNVGIDDAGKEISKLYDENENIIKSIYGNKQDYHMTVFRYLSNKNGVVPVGMRIEEIPDEMIDFSYGNAHNLDELVAEVKKEMFNDNYGTDIPVSWTKKPYKGYFGQYRWTNDNDLSKSYININCILNSDKIKREVVKFVIYHELLHRDNHTHNKEFKSAEHRYPDWPEIERVLFNDFINYDIKEW